MVSIAHWYSLTAGGEANNHLCQDGVMGACITSHMWRLQIVHRDIKSGNILLSRDCNAAKICDVGLARIMNNTSITGSSYNVNTTFAYAAPEILLSIR